MKKATALLMILVIIATVVLIFIRSESLLISSNEITYSNMDQVNTSFNLNDMTYISGDVVGTIKDCSYEVFPSCIIFNSTVILLPKLSVIKDIDGNYYRGRNESLDLNYNISKTEISLFGKKIKGYIFNVGHLGIEKFMDGKAAMLGKLRGTYFYSEVYGILFYENNSEVTLLRNSKREMVSTVYWSVNQCGFFSNKCKD